MARWRYWYSMYRYLAVLSSRASLSQSAPPDQGCVMVWRPAGRVLRRSQDWQFPPASLLVNLVGARCPSLLILFPLSWFGVVSLLGEMTGLLPAGGRWWYCSFAPPLFFPRVSHLPLVMPCEERSVAGPTLCFTQRPNNGIGRGIRVRYYFVGKY